MSAVKDKLVSRKFWVTLVSVTSLVATKQGGAAATVALGYLGVEGVPDAVTRIRAQLSSTLPEAEVPDEKTDEGPEEPTG